MQKRLKLVTIILVIISVFFSFRVSIAHAEGEEDKQNGVTSEEKIDNSSTTESAEVPEGCKGFLTPGAAEILNKVIGWIRVLVPILLIVLGSLDFGQAVMSQDKDSLSKAGSKFLKRSLAAVAIFFVPFIVRVLLSMPGIKDEIKIVDDPLCDLK